MSDTEKIKSFLKQAKTYHSHGLLAESIQVYKKALELIQQNEQIRKNADLVETVKLKIRTLEDDLMVLDKTYDRPELSREMQDLISNLFSFSENKDMAAIESAVALAKFGQYEKAISEVDRLIKSGFKVDKGYAAGRFEEHVKSLLVELSSAFKDLRDQSTQLFRHTRELLQYHKRVKEEERIRAQLSRYVGEALVEKLLKTRKDAVLFENEKKQVTVLFADIRSFTSIAENMPVEEVVSLLNQFFTTMADIIFSNSGLLDKFVGDQVMAVYGIVASEGRNQCDDAIRSAIEMQRAIDTLGEMRRRSGKQAFQIGIGINTGNAILGNLGSQNRMDYTVIGDCVNVAARFQETAKEGQIIIGEQTYRLSRDDFHIKDKGEIFVKNRKKPERCYEVTG